MAVRIVRRITNTRKVGAKEAIEVIATFPSFADLGETRSRRWRRKPADISHGVVPRGRARAFRNTSSFLLLTSTSLAFSPCLRSPGASDEPTTTTACGPTFR